MFLLPCRCLVRNVRDFFSPCFLNLFLCQTYLCATQTDVDTCQILQEMAKMSPPSGRVSVMTLLLNVSTSLAISNYRANYTLQAVGTDCDTQISLYLDPATNFGTSRKIQKRRANRSIPSIFPTKSPELLIFCQRCSSPLSERSMGITRHYPVRCRA